MYIKSNSLTKKFFEKEKTYLFYNMSGI